MPVRLLAVLQEGSIFVDSYHFSQRTPIDNTLVRDCGTGICGHHFRAVRVVRWGIWAAPISRARVALGAMSITAWGRIAANCSTARRVTTLRPGESGRGGRTSARAVSSFMV